MFSRRRLQFAAVGVVLVAYSLLSHYSYLNPQERDLGAGLALAPVVVIGTGLIWRWRGMRWAAISAAAAATLLGVSWPLLANNFAVVNLVQQCGFYAILGLSFAVSLLKNRVPLCTQLADKVHGPLTAQELRYTRQVTAAWAVFFAAIVAATFLLFEFVPLRIWSLFVNFCSLPLVSLMFAAELAVRRRVLPKTTHGGLIATLRVYFAHPP
ncbi:MAG TPA: hypothetical protein VGH12_07705 [Steroidobacteraceae bacterium]|jgi:uncharacterized membrane protein